MADSEPDPANHHQPESPDERVPLALWPVAQTSAQYQRAGRYLRACTAHPGKMLPELARRIITECSAPGDLIVDPMAGIGTTIVEAAELGRRAVGVELDARWVEIANANLDHIIGNQRPYSGIRHGDAKHLPDVLGNLAGHVDLVVTSPPYGCEVGTIDRPAWEAGGSMLRAEGHNYSADRTNLGHARDDTYVRSMAGVYEACHAVLRPGGRLVTVTKNTRRRGRCFDLAAITVALARTAGFTYTQHVVALLAGIRNSALVARPSYWQTTQTRRARQRGEPAHLVAHEDVLVFTKPEETA